MQKQIDPHTAPALKPMIAAAREAGFEVTGAYTLGNTILGAVFA